MRKTFLCSLLIFGLSKTVYAQASDGTNDGTNTYSYTPPAFPVENGALTNPTPAASAFGSTPGAIPGTIGGSSFISGSAATESVPGAPAPLGPITGNGLTSQNPAYGSFGAANGAAYQGAGGTPTTGANGSPMGTSAGVTGASGSGGAGAPGGSAGPNQPITVNGLPLY